MNRTGITLTLLALLVLGTMVDAAPPGRPKRFNLPDTPEDLRTHKTHESGRTWPSIHHDWNLGPTGARGWIWVCRSKEDTGTSRQILITEVAKGSPADGVLAKDDIILGVDGKPFSADARVTYAKAIGAAETKAGKGILRLVRWRNGKTENVQIKLEVMGAWAETAPYNCPKTNRIIDKACEYLSRCTRGGLGGGMTGASHRHYDQFLSKRPDHVPLLLRGAGRLACVGVQRPSSLHQGRRRASGHQQLGGLVRDFRIASGRFRRAGTVDQQAFLWL